MNTSSAGRLARHDLLKQIVSVCQRGAPVFFLQLDVFRDSQHVRDADLIRKFSQCTGLALERAQYRENVFAVGTLCQPEQWAPEHFIEHVAPRPLLIVTNGASDLHHPLDHIQSAFRKAGESKRLEILPYDVVGLYGEPGVNLTLSQTVDYVWKPAAYDYGRERCSWMTHHLTKWIDDGSLRHIHVEIRRHNPVSDTLYINSEA